MDDKIITQIGSLPFVDVSQAVDYSLKHDIPFLPELPKKGDAMLTYIKNPGTLSCLSEFKKHTFERVKVQCVGPATLVLSGYNQDDAVSRAYEHIAKILDGLKAKEIILFLDEPALGHTGIDFKALWQVLFSNFEVTSGVHTCGNMDWDELFSSSIQVISFDASQFDLTKYSKYRSNKKIAWGINKMQDIRDFKDGDLLTLPCGMGTPLYKPQDCSKALESLTKIKEQLFNKRR